MHYFSRLTDIVTANLSALLKETDDPQATIAKVVQEIENGLAASERSVQTALRNEQKVLNDLSELSTQLTQWTEQARTELSNGNESAARTALQRKQEVIDLVAGLEQELQAAVANREQLETTRRALNARLSEARRKQAELQQGANEAQKAQSSTAEVGAPADCAHSDRVEAELEALRREMGDG